MGFDFDEYINKICIGEGTTQGVFGIDAIYTPDGGSPVNLTVQFIENFEKLEFTNANEVITDQEITCFLRIDDLGQEPVQNDEIQIDSVDYTVFDAQKFIPEARKLVLHRKLT